MAKRVRHLKQEAHLLNSHFPPSSGPATYSDHGKSAPRDVNNCPEIVLRCGGGGIAMSAKRCDKSPAPSVGSYARVTCGMSACRAGGHVWHFSEPVFGTLSGQFATSARQFYFIGASVLPLWRVFLACRQSPFTILHLHFQSLY